MNTRTKGGRERWTRQEGRTFIDHVHLEMEFARVADRGKIYPLFVPLESGCSV